MKFQAFEKACTVGWNLTILGLNQINKTQFVVILKIRKVSLVVMRVITNRPQGVIGVFF